MPIRFAIVFLFSMVVAPKLLAAPDLSTAWSTLGLPINATENEIKVAYRKLAKQYSPDLPTTSKEDAPYFTYITSARDILSDTEIAPIYARFLSAVEKGVVPPISWKELSSFTTKRWQMFSVEIADAESVFQAEEARRNPPVEELIEFRHLMRASVAEDRLVDQHLAKAFEFGEELKAYVADKRGQVTSSKLNRLISSFASRTSSWLYEIELSIDGKPLKFSDNLTKSLFREYLKFRLMSEVVYSALRPLLGYVNSRNESVYAVFLNRFFDEVCGSRYERLAMMIKIYRAETRWSFGGSGEFEYLKKDAFTWITEINKDQPYLIRKIANTQSTESFRKFLDRLLNALPSPEFPEATKLQKVSAPIKMAYYCAAFAANGGFAPIDRILANRKLKAEKKK